MLDNTPRSARMKEGRLPKKPTQPKKEVNGNMKSATVVFRILQSYININRKIKERL